LLAGLLAAQNPHPAQQANLDAIRRGAPAVVTGQQVGLFGGPLLTALKAASAVCRAREATAAGYPHVPVFWLAAEDHDLEEVNHAVFPARREARKLTYAAKPAGRPPVGSIAFDASLGGLLEEAYALLGHSDAFDLLRASYRPGARFAAAFAEFLSGIFAPYGLLVLDASGRDFHALGAGVLRQAIEQAREFRQALRARGAELEQAGYNAQVLVGETSSLLFLIDEQGSRQALHVDEEGRWRAGRQEYEASRLLAILEEEPERISPNALLRPVFQDALLPTSVYIGGPAEIAYFAQTEVLARRILGRGMSVLPRFSATLVEPAVAALLERYRLPLEAVFSLPEPQLVERLAARAIPAEGRQRLAATGSALDAEISALLDYLGALDASLGRSAETAASKMRYQMNRLRRLAANFELEKNASLARHAHEVSLALAPGGVLEERVYGHAYYFARYGMELAASLIEHAGGDCPGHKVLFL
jgi:bacillithiol biosynthesis cysteine-adding enzyme BshC